MTLSMLAHRDNIYAASVTVAADVFDHHTGWIDKAGGETFPPYQGGDHLAMTFREPIGVVAAILPWNTPFLLFAQLPDGVVNVVTGPGDPTGEALITHPMVDKISFTGSRVVGRRIVEASAGTMKRVSMELPHTPFGGYKQSGIGREGGRSAYEAYTELKTVLMPLTEAMM